MTSFELFLVLLGTTLICAPQLWRWAQQTWRFREAEKAIAATDAALREEAARALAEAVAAQARDAAAAAALPPLRYVDADGVGWRAPPDWQEPYQPDEGQHDVWKREMRLWLWRLLTNHEDSRCNLKDAGISPRDQWQNAGTLLPAGQELAMAARRLGFLRLAQAAMPEAEVQFLVDCWERHQSAARAHAAEMYARCAAVAKTWDPITRGGAFAFDTEEQTFAMLSFGAYDEDPPVPQGRTLQAMTPFCAPQQVESGDWRTFTRQRE